ncbi:GNAT family N-acetyltransferase [uncultured Alistipes sp.]|uniref:GNAT family N-acetyltransferase n=1 Tax=uncultured Alistipes sp. TaxID=538949 RepID=UPI00259A829C|nr:GNAT family N-acetyltransferase [uncultured Alistipes sp.]
MDEKLVFRRARPADAARIMEIIRQAQAQMRALGSLQWQDGYPAAADIGHDIACGYGWVFEKPEAEKSPEARGSDGTGAAGFRPETAAARKITDTGEAGATGSGADETAATTEEAEETRKAREMREMRETQAAKAAAAQAQGNVVAYGAVVFDGEPAYEAIEGAWLTDGDYVVLHRMAVADGEKGRGVATEFMRRVEAMACGRGTGSMRVDTNFDNRYMLRMLGRLGFVYCGKVRYRSGERLAFEKTLGT